MSENIFSEKTLVPVGLLIALGGGLVSIAVFAGSIWLRGNTNTHAIMAQEKNHTEFKDDIKNHLIRLEKKVDDIRERVK